jgi:hypothetical protein
MESKNISTKSIRMQEIIENGYAELRAERYNFASIVFDKAIDTDSSCADAYLGKALAEVHQKDLAAAFRNNLIAEIYKSLFFSSEKICAAVLANAKIKNELFEYGYESVQDINVTDAKLILEFLASQNYRDVTNRIYMCESYAELEEKAKKHLENYREKLRAETQDIQFSKQPLKSAPKRLIKSEKEIEKKYPGIASELKSLDYQYQEAQSAATETIIIEKGKKAKKWLSFGAIIWALLLIYLNPLLTVAYLIYRFVRYGKSKPTPPVVQEKPIADKVQMDLIENRFHSLQNKYVELCEELRFTLETMLGEEIETFESEASSTGFMKSQGKEIIEKYSKI